MNSHFDSRPNPQTGPILASSLVMLLGVVGVAAIIAFGGRGSSQAVFLLCGAILVPMFLLFLLRSRPQNLVAEKFRWLGSRDRLPQLDYLPEAMRQRRRYGTNAPPSVSEVRELKDGLNNWVPNQYSPKPPRHPA
jgi:hypothetical protein